MRKFVFYSLLYMCIITSCIQNNKHEVLSSEGDIVACDTVPPDSEVCEPDISRSKNTHNTQQDDSIAIGNIHLGVDRNQFAKEKSEFLREHKKIGELKIQSLNGFFYDNRLAAIEIISEKQDFHKNGLSGTGWRELYWKKYHKEKDEKPITWQDKIGLYSKLFDDNIWYFSKEKVSFGVTDLCTTPTPHKSLEDLIHNEHTTCYGHTLIPIREYKENIWGLEALLSELPPNRKEALERKFRLEDEQEWPRKTALDDAFKRTRRMEEVAAEVSAYREQQIQVHKNDPSWSVIIIYYKPLLSRRSHDEIIKQKKDEKNKKKDIDII